MLNIGFQLMITIEILVANLVNYGTTKILVGWGWRLNLTLAAIPALIITVGSIILPNTPNSLIERGKLEKAHSMLRHILGIDNVENEYDDLMAASEQSKLVQHPWSNIIKQKYRAQLVMLIMIPFFQQLTEINVMFYALFSSKPSGFQDDASLMFTVITGLVNFFATIVSIVTFDRFGYQFLFLEGGL